MIFLDRADRSWQPTLVLPFFPSPIDVGLYTIGTTPDETTFVVCPNDRRVIKALSEVDIQIIVIQSNGLDLETAIAFNLINAGHASATISAALPIESSHTRIIIPTPLFDLLSKNGQINFGKAEVLPAPFMPSEIIKFLAQSFAPKEAHGNSFLARLRWTILFGIGQTFLFSIPLLLFGITTWLTGISLLWVTLTAHLITWQIFPFKSGWLKGLALGVLFTALLSIGQWQIGNLNWQIPFGIALIAVWIGGGLMGANQN